MTATICAADGERPLFLAGDRVRVSTRTPVGHYRVPHYVRGRVGTVEVVIEPRAIDNEREGFGLNAGEKRHYYRVAIPLEDLWASYLPAAKDALRIEIFETWLERA
jgi:nitrile hydratase